MKHSIVVVDDDRLFTQAMVRYFVGRGYQCNGVESVADAKRTLSSKTDIAIVDINLLDGDGIELLQYIRHSFPNCNVIIITGFDSLQKRLTSFGLGADDYMQKPIFPTELEARIKRIINKQLITADKGIDLRGFTPDEQSLIEKLQKANGRPVPIESLHCGQSSNAAIYTCLSRLKKKLTGKFAIKTVYGRGWYIVKLG